MELLSPGKVDPEADRQENSTSDQIVETYCASHKAAGPLVYLHYDALGYPKVGDPSDNRQLISSLLRRARWPSRSAALSATTVT
jgi:hypothetical protein